MFQQDLESQTSASSEISKATVGLAKPAAAFAFLLFVTFNARYQAIQTVAAILSGVPLAWFCSRVKDLCAVCRDSLTACVDSIAERSPLTAAPWCVPGKDFVVWWLASTVFGVAVKLGGSTFGVCLVVWEVQGAGPHLGVLAAVPGYVAVAAGVTATGAWLLVGTLEREYPALRRPTEPLVRATL